MTAEQVLEASGIIAELGERAMRIPARSHILAGRLFVGGRIVMDPDEILPEGPAAMTLRWSVTRVVNVRGAA